MDGLGDNQMALLFRHRIRTLIPGGRRSSTSWITEISGVDR